MTPEEKAYHLTEKMTEQLNLTADQSEKISAINVGIAQKNAGIRNATNITNEQKVEILKSNSEARMNMYKNILTDEQYKKCEQTALTEDEL